VRYPRAVAPLRRLAMAFIAVILHAGAAAAHDIPADVRINAFFKPMGDRLELIVRLPLASLIDADFPVRGGGFLDIPRADQVIRDGIKVWLTDNIDVYENGAALAKPRIAAALVSLPSDRSFASYEEARAHVTGPPLPADLDVYWTQQLLDVLLLYDIRSDRSDFSIDMRVERLGSAVTTALRFMPPGGTVRAFEWHGAPGIVYLDPTLSQAVLRFVAEGFWHILDGTDHLLFLACLVIPFRRLRPLIVIATSFTVAHSITLIASAFGYAPDALWFPPLIEFLIAVTIVYMGLENIVGSNISRRWIMAFAFGLIHGFGFSFALREQLQFAGDHLVSSLLGFNLGVEIGQLAVLVVLVPALDFLFKYAVPERLGIIILSALVTHTAWHWMLERWDQLAKFPFPKLDAALFASLMRGALGALILTAIVWLLSGVIRRFIPAKDIVAEKALVKSPSAERR
jgi:HupE / UreJ protein